MPTQPAMTPTPDRLEVNLLGQRQFRAMNTTVDLYTRDLEDVAELVAAEELFHAMELRLSRFIPESELCLLNDRAGQEVAVSSVMLDILEQAMRLHRVTHGAFEPAILPHLEAAGYDRSFEKLEWESNGFGRGVVPPERLSIWQVKLDQGRSTVRAPAGLRIDLGGIGKGYTVDAAARLLAHVGNFVVNAGGDLFASGCGPDGDGWLVAVTDPTVAGKIVSLVRLYDQALATSTTAARRWMRDGRLQHHLIDPRTSQPAQSGVLSASVIARSATEADVFAKTAFLMGATLGLRFLENEGAAGLLVLEDGAIATTANWPGSLD